jgi:hypothetical protein
MIRQHCRDKKLAMTLPIMQAIDKVRSIKARHYKNSAISAALQYARHSIGVPIKSFAMSG